MPHRFADEQAQLDAVIKTAQYLSGLGSEREIWAELGRVVVHFLGGELVGFLARRPDDRLVLHHCSGTETACGRLLDTAEATARQVMETGFLATEQVWLGEDYALAFLALDHGTPTAGVMIIGQRGAEPLPRDVLNLYLAAAGLFRSTLTRLSSQHRFVAMADNVPEMLFQLVRFPDGKLQFTYVSGGSRAALGLSPEELLADAARFYVPLPAEERREFEAAVALAAGRINRVFRWGGNGAGERQLLLNALATRQEEGTTVWDGALQDITERYRMEEERKRYLQRLEDSMEATVQVMASTIEMRDPYTAGHQRRVADIARHIAEEMQLPEDEVHGITLAASIHDVGKIHIPAEILSFPGHLGELEFELVKTHPTIGYEILKVVDFPWPVAEMVYQHHERVDGSGYPRGIKGTAILLGARIIAVADVVESIASFRPYRAALGIDEALEEIETHRGALYDPAVVDACLRLFRDKGFAIVAA